MRFVERVRIGENILWKQSQTGFGVPFRICMKEADIKILRLPLVGSKLKYSLTIYEVRIALFSSGFSSLVMIHYPMLICVS